MERSGITVRRSALLAIFLESCVYRIIYLPPQSLSPPQLSRKAGTSSDQSPAPVLNGDVIISHLREFFCQL